MDQTQALNVLVQAAQVAQSKGAFSLQEAAMVAEATSAFAPAQETSEPVATNDVSEENTSDEETES